MASLEAVPLVCRFLPWEENKNNMPSDIIKLEREVEDIYDRYRTAQMNRKYYAQRLTTTSRYNTAYEGILALGASTSIAAWTLWKTDVGQRVWAIFGGAVAILVVLKPLFGLPRRIVQFSRLYTGYTDLCIDLEQVVREIKKRKDLTRPMKNVVERALNRLKVLAREDEVNPSKRLLRKCQDEVNREIPLSSLWYPHDDVYTDDESARAGSIKEPGSEQWRERTSHEEDQDPVPPRKS
jgi:hypothetical protein